MPKHNSLVFEFDEVIANGPDQLFQDVSMVLTRLKRQGFKLGVVSSSYSAPVIRRSLNGLLYHVDVIAGDVKDKTSGLRELCVDWEVDPKQVIFVSHLPDDIRVARNVGLRPIGMTRGKSHEDPDVHRRAKALMESGASATVFDLHELNTWIELHAETF